MVNRCWPAWFGPLGVRSALLPAVQPPGSVMGRIAPAYGIYSHRLGDLWLPDGASNSGGAALLRFFIQCRADDGADAAPTAG